MAPVFIVEKPGLLVAGAPPRAGAQGSASPRRGDAAAARAKDLSTTYGVKAPAGPIKDFVLSHELDGWRNDCGTLSPKLLTSNGQLPRIVGSAQGGNRVTASMSMSCLRPTPSQTSQMRYLPKSASALELSSREDSRFLGGSLETTFDPDQVAMSAEFSPAKEPLGERFRLPACIRDQQPLSPLSLDASPTSESSKPSRKQMIQQKSKEKARSHSRPRTNHDEHETPDARSIAAELAKRRSKEMQRKMMIENNEYMDGELKELRRGRDRLRIRVNECSNEELFENRSFYTSYAMTIKQRGDLRKQQDAQKALRAKTKENRALGASGGASHGKRAHLAVTWGSTESHHSEWHQPLVSSTPSSCASVSFQQPSDDQVRRKKKRGDLEACSKMAMEVNVLRLKMEGSHRKLQNHVSHGAGTVRHEAIGHAPVKQVTMLC